MSRKALRFGTTFAGLILPTLLSVPSGCGTGITADTTVSDALSLLAQVAGQDATLSQLTVGDLVQGFQDYASQFATGATAGAPPASLTAEQQAQLEDLQGQLDRGEITPEEFAQQVHDLIGDLAPGYAFAGREMMGGPFPAGPEMYLADELQLTDEQRQQAEDIFTQLHTDIDTLRQDAQDQIEALLTADQLATLDELQSQDRPPPPGGPRGGHGGGPMGPPPENADQAGLDLGPLGRFADDLQLTDEQQTAIAQIHTDFQAAVEARHQKASDEFRAILTDDQLTRLDELESESPQ
jgi:Spy/CpxP family protein refolding chaperone